MTARAGAADLEAVARSVLGEYPVEPGAGLTLLSLSENAVFAVDEPGGRRTVLRLHRPGYRSPQEILSELAWVRALGAEGSVPVPDVLPARDGRLLVPGHARDAVRFAWVDGEHPAGAAPDGDAGAGRLVPDFEVLGAVAARLHAHARRWTPPAGFTRGRWDATGILGPGDGLPGTWGHWRGGIGVGPAETEVLAALETELRRRLARYGTDPDRFGLVHADMRLANLLVERASGRVTVIDFDDCGYGWFGYDAGAAVSFMEHDPAVPALLDAWSRGYRTVAPLSADDEAELGTFVLLRRLLLIAWLGSRPDADPARELGADYTRTGCDLAERFLTGASYRSSNAASSRT